MEMDFASMVADKITATLTGDRFQNAINELELTQRKFDKIETVAREAGCHV